MGRGIPPAYVFAILDDRVLLSGGLNPIFHMLATSSYRDRVCRETPSTLAVSYRPDPNGILHNSDLLELLSWLSEHGVAFTEHRVPEKSMADLARTMQTSGRLPRRITTLEWLNQDEWKVRECAAPRAAHARVIVG